ncbi:hypothetical protein ACKAV7_012347 [Fusarium commune]|uniref:Uncharacterized protein n=1 Tax=Fusarium oxysporum f. sp. rapae TaxID=485398 RepID=A0A8J5NQD8_FUSOX|nr:hypothetical protein Forpe1208_v013288 [Fusarium oxysporum f. sp. rapae]KAI7764768.1 hypothetical protein LZL87_003973 [Fusarium oxysporum]
MEGVAEYEIDCLVAPGTSSTKNICLSHAEVSGSTLRTMSRAPKALETLKIFVGGLHQRDPGRYSIRSKELGKSLLQHKNTLPVLELDMSELDYTEGQIRKTIGWRVLSKEAASTSNLRWSQAACPSG